MCTMPSLDVRGVAFGISRARGSPADFTRQSFGELVELAYMKTRRPAIDYFSVFEEGHSTGEKHFHMVIKVCDRLGNGLAR